MWWGLKEPLGAPRNRQEEKQGGEPGGPQEQAQCQGAGAGMSLGCRGKQVMRGRGTPRCPGPPMPSSDCSQPRAAGQSRDRWVKRHVEKTQAKSRWLWSRDANRASTAARNEGSGFKRSAGAGHLGGRLIGCRQHPPASLGKMCGPGLGGGSRIPWWHECGRGFSQSASLGHPGVGVAGLDPGQWVGRAEVQRPAVWMLRDTWDLGGKIRRACDN